jgi:hypothetical protein
MNDRLTEDTILFVHCCRVFVPSVPSSIGPEYCERHNHLNRIWRGRSMPVHQEAETIAISLRISFTGIRLEIQGFFSWCIINHDAMKSLSHIPVSSLVRSLSLSLPTSLLALRSPIHVNKDPKKAFTLQQHNISDTDSDTCIAVLEVGRERGLGVEGDNRSNLST